MREDGEWVSARFGSNFCLSLLNKKDTVLRPGKYMFMVDPHWNISSLHNKLYKEVLIDVYAP